MFGPKVEEVVSSEPISLSGAFGMLSRFLRTEQQKHDPVSIHQSHWEDLYRVAETLAESQHEQETLRELRLMVAAPVSSPNDQGAGRHFVFDEDETTPSQKLIPVDHTSSIAKKEEAETTESNAKDEKAAKKSVKKEKKAKKEKKKAKKRKRESSD